MQQHDGTNGHRAPGPAAKVGYVLKRYPRYSETFVVNEILAHEEAGLEIGIYALRPPVDTHFQSLIGQVRASVTYLPAETKSSEFWRVLYACADRFPNTWRALDGEGANTPRNAHQALELALKSASDGLTHFHAHFATDAAAVARLASRITGIPYSVTAHAKDIFHESVDQDILFDRLSDARSVVTVSNYNVGFLDAAFGDRLTNVTRIYNGMDLTQFTYLDPGERPPTILGVGRLVEKKGFDYLIEAASLLKARGVHFDCRIVGHGELYEHLQTLVDELGVGDVVRLEGPRPSAEVIKALNGASVLAAPCVVGSDGNRDGLPTVLLESMAVGTPCVSTDVTGIPEVVIDGVTGLQVPQHDSEALADALAKLLNDGSLRSRLAREARALIEKDFDIRKNTSRIRELFGRGDAVHNGSLAEVA